MEHGIKLIAVSFAMLGLSACASMNANECLLGDWHAIGFEDGVQGYTNERLGEHRKACAKHGVAPDFVAYRAGRQEGLREFCLPSRGFSLGENGYRYNGICSADLEPDFLDAYRRGQQLHGLRSSVHTVSQAVAARQQELRTVEEQIRDTEALLISPDTSAEDRILALVDLKQLSEDADYLEAEIAGLIEERAGHQRELDSYEALLADSAY